MEESNEYQSKIKPPSFTRKQFQPPPIKPLSPRDTTPIIVNGNTLSREDLTPIIDPPTVEEHTQITDATYNNTTDITMENEEVDPSSKVLTHVPNQEIKSPVYRDQTSQASPLHHVGSTSHVQPTSHASHVQPTSHVQPVYTSIQNIASPKTTSQVIEEQTSAIYKDVEMELYVSKDNPNKETRPYGQRFAFVDHVESTDNVDSRTGPIPKITSPTDQMSAEQKMYRTLPPNTIQLPKRDPNPQPPEFTEDVLARAHDCYLKYQILQKSWQEYKFPNLDEKLVYSNPKFIIDTYERSVQRIQIDMDVNQYKIALIIMFLVIEVVCVKFMGLDAGGYTLSQIKAMNRYEKLLIEIGEKKLILMGGSWSPEVRILFIGLFNCGLFILMKYLSSVLGPELVGYISPIVNGLFSGVFDNSKTASLPDELPQRQQDITGMLGGFATMAAQHLGNGAQSNASANQNNARKASRRPIYRE